MVQGLKPCFNTKFIIVRGGTIVENYQLAIRWLDVIAPGLLGAVILLLIPYQASGANSLLSDISEQPQILPKFVGGALILITIYRLAAQWLRKRDTSASNGESVVMNVSLWVGLVILLAYVWLLPYLGFFPATFLVMILFSRLLGNSSWPRNALYSAAVTLAVWYAFSQLLHIPLPKGWFGI
jgi:hypothetical protein